MLYKVKQHFNCILTPDAQSSGCKYKQNSYSTQFVQDVASVTITCYDKIFHIYSFSQGQEHLVEILVYCSQSHYSCVFKFLIKFFSSFGKKWFCFVKDTF